MGAVRFFAVNELTGVSGILQTTKLNVTAGQKKQLKLNRKIPDLRFATSVLKFVEGNQETRKISEFNNSDSANFDFDSSYVEFTEGKMHLKDTFDIEHTQVDLDTKKEFTIPLTQFVQFKKIDSISIESVGGEANEVNRI